MPLPEHYSEFAAACARYVARSRGCHIWIVGNEPNHEEERPQGQLILPHDYAQAYQLCRAAIRAVSGHDQDQVLVAGPAPWNATTTYPGNEKGDWVKYFVDVIALLADDDCDGFSLHTYTHSLDPSQVTGDFFQAASGYQYLHNEFRSYRDFMNAIPDRFRNRPVYITEADPATRGQGWNPGANVGWVQAAYREIGTWNCDQDHQPILALILYRWPLLPDQPEWSISNRPGIIEDFKQALAAEPADTYRLRLPQPVEKAVVLEPGNLLPKDKQWAGQIAAPLGLNLRTGPTAQHQVIQILPFEAAVTILAELDDWLFVSTMGKTGYVSRHFVLRPLTPKDLRPVAPGEFLSKRPPLLSALLAPPREQQLTLDPATASWMETTIATVWNRFGLLALQISGILQVDPAVAIAVLAVESGGQAFGPDGRMMIRFENHIFFDQWGKLDPERFAKYLRFDLSQPWQGHQWRPDPSQPWQDFHGDPRAEWQVFTLASTLLNDHTAKLSISMGAPQIMGFNFSLLGYADVDHMFIAFNQSANSQIVGFFDFVKADAQRLEWLKQGDFAKFATSYNGPGQDTAYGNLIREAVTVYNRLRPTPSSAAASTPRSATPIPGVATARAGTGCWPCRCGSGSVPSMA